MALKVSAILLAAGCSKRMGRSKQLLPLGDKPAIVLCIETILKAGITDTVVVTGQDDKVRRAIDDLHVKIIINEDHESEMAESVRKGLAGADGSATGVLICLSDHPLISARTLVSIIDMHSECPDKIIIPLYEGRKGHPALFPSFVINEVFSGLNMREVVYRKPGRVKLMDVADEGVVLDMDTTEDYNEILRKMGKG